MADYGSRAYDKEQAERRAALAELGFVEWKGAGPLVYLCMVCSSLVVSGKEPNFPGLWLHKTSLHRDLTPGP